MKKAVLKAMLITWACLWTGWCPGQEPVKEFIDKHGWVVDNGQNASGYRMVVKDAKGKLNGPIAEYDSLGRKTMTGTYVAGDRAGLFERYHPNGRVSSRVEYFADLPIGKYESWYESGKPKETGNYPADTAARRGKWDWDVYRMETFRDSTGMQLVENGSGNWHSLHENGKLHINGAYRNGLREGEWSFYDEAGRLTNTEHYVNGRLEKGLYRGPAGDEFTYDSDTFEVLPEYPGGMRGLAQYLRHTIRYPKEARRARASGTVFVGFVIHADGKVSDVHILKGIHQACDAEAVRVIEIMPPWQAGRQQGRPVPVRYSLPIRFVMQ